MVKLIQVIIISMISLTTLHGQSVELSDQLKSNIQSLLDTDDVKGIVIGTTHAGEVKYYSKGVRSTEGKETIDENAIFEIGSISKTFTGLLLADMHLKGKVKLEDDIQKYLPEGIQAPTKEGKTIKLFHLSNHTSGLPRMPTNFKPKDPTNPFQDYTEEQMYEFLEAYDLDRDIGSMYEYSNFAAGLLGHILSSRSEMTYEALLKESITEPLGMDHTGITHVEGPLAKGHMAGLEMTNWDFAALQGAGAIRSCASDMMIYLQANMGMVESELYPAMQLAHKNSRAVDSKPIIGLGWHTMIYEGKEIIWHNGATGGYTSFMGWIKGTDKGVVVLNNSTKNVDEFGLHALIPSFPLTAIRKSIDLDEAILETYVGQYALAPTFILTVTKKADQLLVQATGQAALPIYPESSSKFFYKVVDAQLEFNKNVNGKVESVTLFQGGQEMLGKRIE